MIQGSCLCGVVAYRAEGLIGPLGHCHCHTCRKAHGAAFATTGRAARAGFAWTRGAGIVAHFESSPGKLRHFCPRCGSHLMAEWVEKDQVILRAGSIDSEIAERPKVHIWTSQMAPWYDPDEKLPRLPEGVPASVQTGG
jgi:hypothetical protein